jgi:hypothetical protein
VSTPSPLFAAGLSAVMPGLGQLYNCEDAKAAAIASYPKTRPTSIQIAKAEGSPLLQVLKRLAQIEIFHD